ncbi:transcriptional regulator, partial [Kitasatospora sp. LaBMicrA B282]|uniref:transcriptional regulator n=1 Tax=Kitasatospora sp. LaBMicrA B282 TaxID=3420949 RepID=UPI003D144714
MSTTAPHSWPPPGPAVERLAEARATGALHTTTGTLYLEDGAVVHAESPAALDLGALLTRSGRLTATRWQQTREAFADRCLVGPMLVGQGCLSRGELELCQLAAVHDAAFFVLGAPPAATHFEAGVRHWLGPVLAVPPGLLRHEAVRRRDRLARIWPWPQVDDVPLRRTGRPAGHRLPLSPRRRELLGLADGRRTPVELARLLGRSSYATLVEVRRLAAAGLLVTPAPTLPGPPAAPPPGAVPGAATA